MHKIYMANKPLFITGERSAEIEDYLHRNDTLLMDELNAHAVNTMIHEMETEAVRAGVFLYSNPDEVLEAFRKKLVTIPAAGGFVHTTGDQVLLIFRKGKWDLPKGKLDEGEDLPACALREVKEETGIGSLEIEKPLCTSFHTYHEKGKHILKESHWFLMRSPKQEDLVPQLEEDIEKCEWVAIDKLDGYMVNTHASILDVVNAGVKMLGEARKA